MALLSKQLWRFLIYPNSLVSRVYSARYFKRGSILEAELSYSPSYVWRSIYSAMPFFHDNIRWRIGNGESVSILNDEWVRSEGRTLLNGKERVDLSGLSVNWLIDGNVWNQPLILECFEHGEADAILRTLVPTVLCDDNPYWSHETSGNFSVKSSYRVLSIARTAALPIIQLMWNKLWQLKLPLKI